MTDLIQWPRAKYWDSAWNPIIGCKQCSPACEHCYAAAWANRFGQSFEPHETRQKPPRKGVVFCGNMTDLFGEWCGVCDSTAYIAQASLRSLQTDGAAQYLWLTKRADRMCNAIRHLDRVLEHPEIRLSCQHFGFTAENQQCYDRRVREFRACMPYWANCWLSVEPLIGPVDLGLQYIAPEDCPFGWVVVGCESGQDRRPCKIEWVESVVAQCLSAWIPVFVKQLDLNGRCETDINKFPKHLRIRQVPWAKEVK